MAMRWYVVQVFSGFEDKVAEQLKIEAERAGLSDRFGEVLVPREEVVELRQGKKISSQQKFFPGYLLVEMDMDDETWHIVRDIPRVGDFLGSDHKPHPMMPHEVAALKRQIEEGIERPRPKVLFEVGEAVRVIDGPFASFNGLVDEVQEDKGKLKVSVSIFGRPTPVELDYVQVEKG